MSHAQGWVFGVLHQPTTTITAIRTHLKRGCPKHYLLGETFRAIFCRRRHQPMRGHFGRLVTRSSFVTTATALLAITASSRKNPNSATLSGSEIKKLNFGGKQKYPAAKALANEVRTPTVLP